MLSEIFYWVLNISITGSLVGLIILSLQKIKKIPRFAIYLMWGIPLVRFWIPLGVANKYSLLSLISQFTTKTVLVDNKLSDISMTNFVMGASSYFPIEYKTNLLETVFRVASVIWIIGMTIAIIISFLLYFFTKSEIRFAVNIKDNIYKSDRITSPAVYGIIHPKIIIPSEIANGEIDYIIMHESVHIRRKDNLLRVIAVTTVCLHWFNPLSWIFLKCFFEDMELSCDAKVLKNLNKNQTKDYANAILACASRKTFFVAAFGGVKTRVRIENILSYRKLTVLSSVCFALLFISVAIILFTNAVV